jgi:predicted metal-dependent phosphotriesterase family hydrolase
MADLAACGIRTIVDLTTVDLGRDIDLIVAVARRSPVQVLVSTGVWWMLPRWRTSSSATSRRVSARVR